MRQVVARLKAVRAVQGHRGGERSARIARFDPGDRLARSRRAQNCDSRTSRIVQLCTGSSRLPIQFNWQKSPYQLMNGDTICLVVSVRGGRLGRARDSRASLNPAVPLHHAHGLQSGDNLVHRVAVRVGEELRLT